MLYADKACDPENDDNWDRVDEVTVLLLGWGFLMGTFMCVLHLLELYDSTL